MPNKKETSNPNNNNNNNNNSRKRPSQEPIVIDLEAESQPFTESSQQKVKSKGQFQAFKSLPGTFYPLEIYDLSRKGKNQELSQFIKDNSLNENRYWGQVGLADLFREYSNSEKYALEFVMGLYDQVCEGLGKRLDKVTDFIKAAYYWALFGKASLLMDEKRYSKSDKVAALNYFEAIRNQTNDLKLKVFAAHSIVIMRVDESSNLRDDDEALKLINYLESELARADIFSNAFKQEIAETKSTLLRRMPPPVYTANNATQSIVNESSSDNRHQIGVSNNTRIPTLLPSFQELMRQIEALPEEDLRNTNTLTPETPPTRFTTSLPQNLMRFFSPFASSPRDNFVFQPPSGDPNNNNNNNNNNNI